LKKAKEWRAGDVYHPAAARRRVGCVNGPAVGLERQSIIVAGFIPAPV
jgi:hypothetical protein